SNVGMERMPKLAASSGLWSTSTLATLNRSGFSDAISSRTGASARHGPHQFAQKSTSTGLSECDTSLSKVASVTWTGFILENVGIVELTGRYPSTGVSCPLDYLAIAVIGASPAGSRCSTIFQTPLVFSHTRRMPEENEVTTRSCATVICGSSLCPAIIAE